MHASATEPLDHALRELPHGALWVAYSGGMDSTALLHALADRCAHAGRALRAVHVHHGLNARADAWATHCQASCDALGVPLHIARVRVDLRAGTGIEAAAREARRAAFVELLQPGEVIALAHHRDDQAETFLLRALRGSGPDGLAAMRAWTALGAGHAWRPWLAMSRDAITAHARSHGLRWIDDDSNADDRFDRNYLRRHVMPLLAARWPHAGEALAVASAQCAQAVDLLDAEDARALASARTLDPATLRLPALRLLPPQRRVRVVRRWIAGLGLPPLPRRGVAALDAMLESRRDANPSFDWHRTRLQAWGELLHAATMTPALDPAFEVQWEGAAPLALPGGGTLRLLGASGFEAPVRVRARRGGERIRLPGRPHSHALKHVLQDLQVPPWVRARLPVLVDGANQVLAAADLAYAAGFDAWLHARNARLQWDGQ